MNYNLKSFLHQSGLLIVLWLILTAINITKAFHIDDTFHLEAAKHIVDHPMRPMSGMINWYDSPSPIFSHNQPPLFFYLLALVSWISGNDEISTHLLISLFTFGALFYLKKSAELLNSTQTNLLLVLFAFCPAFIINQNIMVDVPVLFIVLSTLFYTLLMKKTGHNKYAIYAALLISAGLLIKYSVLPLLAAFTIVLILTGQYRKLFAVFIPLTIIAGWSFWNLWEFKSVHVLNRGQNNFQPETLFAFVSCLGSMSPFAIIFFNSQIPGRITKSSC